MGTFGARMDTLNRIVGTGKLEGTVTIDQVYAQNQHETKSFRHPRGGQAKYLEDALKVEGPKILKALASRALAPDGLVGAMTAGQIRLRNRAARLTPRLYGNLKKSGAVTVRDKGMVVMKIPAEVKRLTDAQLRAQERRGRRRR